jgi:pimeloyl-ACP methyl ester carboxylesterase
MPPTGSGGDRMREFRNLYIAWANDTDKTIDYLETRNDIDLDNIFYLGMSYGSLFNTHTLLFENRYKGAILYVGGVFPTFPPLVDGINHMPRINIPFLMLNGEQDYLVPKAAAMFFYQSTGTPEKDKKIVFYDSGHWPLPRNQMIKETLDFIKKYSD